MAEQTPLGKTEVSTEPIVGNFEEWLRQDEAKNLSPETPPPPVEKTPDETTPPPATEAPPITEPPPAAETVEAAPPAAETVTPDEPDEEPPAEHKGKKRPSWKMVREEQNRAKDLEASLREERGLRLRTDQERADRDRRMEALEREIQALKGEKPAESVTVIEDDPLTKVEKKLEEIDQRDSVRAQEMARQQIDTRIRSQEQDFISSNPKGKNYRDALAFAINSEKKEMDVTGVTDTLATDIMRENPTAVRQYAISAGKNEREAARELAYNVGVAARRDAILRGAFGSGKNVAEALVEFAEARGYRPEAPAAASPPPPPPARDPKEVKEASTSLSAVGRTTPPPAVKVISTRRQLMELPDAEMQRYIFEHDETDPGWDQRLAEG